MASKRLMKSDQNRVISGVCGGIGEYLGLDPVIIRVLWVLFAFTGGSGILGYIVFSIVIPDYNPKLATRELTPPHREPTNASNKNTRIILAVGLILIGAGSIAERWIPWFEWRMAIPLAMLIGGIYLLSQNNKNELTDELPHERYATKDDEDWDAYEFDEDHFGIDESRFEEE